MRRSIRCVAAMCVLVAPSVARAQGGATELNVRLFSTQSVRELRVYPVQTTVRECARCAARPVVAPFDVIAGGRAGELRMNGRAAHALLLEGQLRLVASGGKSASAAGRWAISAAVDGLHIVVTLPSERYVMAVLESEAAPGEPAESLKALAVVARSFALADQHRHGLEGLCDSTHCQAMRLDRVPDRVAEAVRATAGEALWFGGKQVEGYFTQNCGGATANAADVWGGPQKQWLVGHPDMYCQRQPSQWHAEVDERALRDALAAEGWHVGGQLTGFRIVAKGGTGRVMRVEVSGGGRSLQVSAASLRFAVNRALGWNTLRSDWYEARMVRQPNGVRRIVFDGKGYGHGVGLCQAGAAAMARSGMRYREILRAYFPGAHVQVGAGDEGWRQSEAHGWSLRFVGDSTGKAEVLTAVNAAWAQARKKWSGGVAVSPLVTIAPNTELFRQMTGQPGWALASTAGTNVVLQPLAILQQHGASGTLQGLLLHEFLHASLEAEAGSAAPLWLREGLVEMLAGERGETGVMTPAQVDEALRHAASLREAQTAHRAACGLVRKLAAERGEATVRAWLRSGVPGDVPGGTGK